MNLYISSKLFEKIIHIPKTASDESFDKGSILRRLDGLKLKMEKKEKDGPCADYDNAFKGCIMYKLIRKMSFLMIYSANQGHPLNCLEELNMFHSCLTVAYISFYELDAINQKILPGL